MSGFSYQFEFPVDACSVLRVEEYLFWVQPEDGISPAQVLDLSNIPARLDGEPFNTDGFLGIWDLLYFCPVGGRWEYESLRGEFSEVW